MTQWILSLFEGSTAELTFFSIFAAGMVFTLTSLVFGGDHSGVEHDVDHDVDHAGEGSDADAHGPGLLSMRGISLFAVGFGGVAFLVQRFTGKVLVSSVSGLMFGWVFAMLLITMLRVFLRQQASSAIQPKQILAATGVVTTGIPKGQQGEVLLSVAGTQMSKMASSADGKVIPQGTQVRVVRYFGGTVVVEKI